MIVRQSSSNATGEAVVDGAGGTWNQIACQPEPGRVRDWEWKQERSEP